MGKPGRTAALLDRAEEVYACLFLTGASAEAELAVIGRYPRDLVGVRLDLSCDWVRHESAQPWQPYWRARGRPLEVCSPASGLLLAAQGAEGAMQRMLARRLRPEAGPVERARAGDPRVGPFLAGAALFACLPLPGVPAGVLPVRQLWLAARREGEGYELGALAALAGAPEAPNARALASLVRLAAASWLRKAGIAEVPARLRALEVTVEADVLAARGLRLSEAELQALLLDRLRPASEDAGARGGD
jgi:hypothetical protein